MIFEAFLNTLSPSLCLSENDKTKNKNQKVDEENDDDEEGATKKNNGKQSHYRILKYITFLK